MADPQRAVDGDDGDPRPASGDDHSRLGERYLAPFTPRERQVTPWFTCVSRVEKEDRFAEKFVPHAGRAVGCCDILQHRFGRVV